MRKRAWKIACALVTLVAFSITATAQTVDVTRSVGATSTVAGIATMMLGPDTVTYGVTNMNAFPTAYYYTGTGTGTGTDTDTGTDYFSDFFIYTGTSTATGTDPYAGMPVVRMLIYYKSNHDPWLLHIYTNNTNVPMYDPGPPATGRYAKGGLARSDGSAVVPMKWISQSTTRGKPSIYSIPGYNFIKDLRDEDDPATPGVNESWAVALASGYPVIAFGNPSSGICVDPTNPPTYNGDAINGKLAVFIAGLFGDYPPTAGNYYSRIYFDLVHE